MFYILSLGFVSKCWRADGFSSTLQYSILNYFLKDHFRLLQQRKGFTQQTRDRNSDFSRSSSNHHLMQTNYFRQAPDSSVVVLRKETLF